MRNLLLICPYFPPTAASGSFRLLGFARHLPQHGWNAMVVACGPVPWEPQDETLASQIPPETSVRYVQLPRGRGALAVQRGLRRTGIVDSYWLWQRSAVGVCRRMIHESRIDAIVTSGPPHSAQLLGRKLKRRTGLPWIADFRDPWVGDAPVRGLMRIRRHWETSVIDEADAVIANAPMAEMALRRTHRPNGHKIVTITNGYDPELIPRRRSTRSCGERIEIVHTGELYAGRDPRPLLDAVGEICRTDSGLPSFGITFLGRDEWSGMNVSEEIRRRGCESNVFIGGHVPYEEAKQHMVEADILLLIDTAGRRSGVPAKLYEYIGCNRPILALTERDGDTSWVLQSSKINYRIANPLDVDEIRNALGDLLSISLEKRNAPSVPECEGPFTRRESARQLSQLLDRLVSSTSNGKFGR